jgi:hypothetical protein
MPSTQSMSSERSRSLPGRWLGLALLFFACGEQDDRPARWSYIHETIIRPSCTTSGCHSELGHAADLVLEDSEDAYRELVGAICGNDPTGRNFVAPGQPENSSLMYQLLGIERVRMPPDIPLPEVDIALIERWILEGALCN